LTATDGITECLNTSVWAQRQTKREEDDDTLWKRR